MTKPTSEKPHYFELVMNSVSDGKLNQEVVIVREYADTPGELVLKQMTFTKDAFQGIAGAVIDAMDKQSMPFQEVGLAEMEATFGGGKGKQPQ